jgi:nickel transport protein
MKILRILISIKLLIGLLAQLFLSGQVLAHGLRGEINSHEAICATATYDNGEPVSYAAVEIIAPNSKLPFQGGGTDRNGHFCFRPDSPGQWQVKISDGMGHQIELKSTVSQGVALP